MSAPLGATGGVSAGSGVSGAGTRVPLGRAGIDVGAAAGTKVEGRVLGRVRGPREGHTLVCVAGIHGNEPAGVLAVQRVLGPLRERASDVTGELVALAGNVTALAAGRRFIDRDLNRAWTDERLRALRDDRSRASTVEDREQIELIEEIEAALHRARGTVHVLDLHTTSGPGGIFSAFTDALPQRAFAARFPVPMILGLEEQVEGTMLNLLSTEGLVSITIETGQHDEPAAVDRAEAALWIAVVAAGLLPESLAPEAIAARALLLRETGHLPPVLEMRYRRPVVDGDGFRMDPGYSNFDPVRAGQVIARDRTGPIAVEETALLLMPLYQEQGEDGYFLVREVAPFWMRVSHALRVLGVSRVAHLLPGVRRVAGTDDEVLVDRRVARFFARQLFHLLGFREVVEAGPHLLMRRRPFDEGRYLRSLPPPASLGTDGADGGG